MEIGGLPILWHVIQLYAVQGFTRFLLATGYKGELIERFAAGDRVAGGSGGASAWTPALTRPPAGASSCCEPHLAGESLLRDLRRRAGRHRP